MSCVSSASCDFSAASKQHRTVDEVDEEDEAANEEEQGKEDGEGGGMCVRVCLNVSCFFFSFSVFALHYPYIFKHCLHCLL